MNLDSPVLYCLAWRTACKLWHLVSISSCFLFILVRGRHSFLKERRDWCLGREKVEGGHWNLTTQTSLKGSDSPGPGEEGWKLTSTSIAGLCARLDIHLSKTWYLFKPHWVSIDTGEWSKGEYALCHRACTLWSRSVSIRSRFHQHLDHDSLPFFLKVFFSLLACLLCSCYSLPFPDASLCVLFILSVEVIRSWILGTC